MRVSTRFLLAVCLLTGLWTWSGASAVCEAAVELSAAPTCCPESCKCEPSACGCSLTPAEPHSAPEEAPMLLPEPLQGASVLAQASQHPVVLNPAPAAKGSSDRSAWPAFAAKHSDVLLELLCVQIV